MFDSLAEESVVRSLRPKLQTSVNICTLFNSFLLILTRVVEFVDLARHNMSRNVEQCRAPCRAARHGVSSNVEQCRAQLIWHNFWRLGHEQQNLVMFWTKHTKFCVSWPERGLCGPWVVFGFFGLFFRRCRHQC